MDKGRIWFWLQKKKRIEKRTCGRCCLNCKFYNAWDDYMIYGGLPQIVGFQSERQKILFELLETYNEQRKSTMVCTQRDPDNWKTIILLKRNDKRIILSGNIRICAWRNHCGSANIFASRNIHLFCYFSYLSCDYCKFLLLRQNILLGQENN